MSCFSFKNGKWHHETIKNIAQTIISNPHWSRVSLTINVVKSYRCFVPAHLHTMSSSVCFSCGWFLRCVHLTHVRCTRVLGWLQMALVAVHKQTLGCKPPHDCLLMLSIDLATFCGRSTNGPLLGPFQNVSY